MALERYHKQILGRKKKSRRKIATTHERTLKIYVVRSLAYIQGNDKEKVSLTNMKSTKVV